LPPEMSHLSQLRACYVGENPLTSVPPEFGQHPHLRDLYQCYLDGLI
jgi:hypothetical protein